MMTNEMSMLSKLAITNGWYYKIDVRYNALFVDVPLIGEIAIKPDSAICLYDNGLISIVLSEGVELLLKEIEDCEDY